MNETLGPFDPASTLAVYGTLAPGESNHHVVADIGGQWIDVGIKGDRFLVGWGGDQHPEGRWFPGFRRDASAPIIPALAFVSDDLDRFWERLDRFEGPGYQRVVTDLFDRVDGRPLGTAYVYEAKLDYWGNDIRPEVQQ